jgi:hypothetical protein
MNQTPKALYIVRGRVEDRYLNASPVRSTAPFLMEGAFATREQAEAFRMELEARAAASGDPGPLMDFGDLRDLMALSSFEPGIFRDYLNDHGIPDPETFASSRRVGGPTPLNDWLSELSPKQLADLYAALHHFRFSEIVETPFVVGDYGEDQWEEWEKNLSAGPPDDGDEGFTEVEGGFTAEPTGWFERRGPPNVESPEPTPEYPAPHAPPWPPHPAGEDDIPF